MANFFYILVAPSAVGKSDLLRKMEGEGFWTGIRKISTRDVRYNENGEKDDVEPIDNECYNGLSEEAKSALRSRRIEKIKEICGGDKGVVYYKNGNLYGITIKDVLDGLEACNVVAIMSDFKAIRSLKETPQLFNRVITLYIASSIDERVLLKRFKQRETFSIDIDSDEQKKAVKNIRAFSSMLASAVRLNYMDRVEKVMPLLNEEWNTVLPYFETIKNRGANISKLYFQYIENIALIDYAILNFYDLEYMYAQCRNIIQKNNTAEQNRLKLCQRKPPVFMVCAAPSSGKKTLMEIIGDLGEINNDIRITTKYAQRHPKATDGRDGMIAIGPDKPFEDFIPNPEKIWKWTFHKQEDATSYAVNKEEIDKNISEGIAQIFISNMGQIEVARKLYPNNLVVLYLHAAHETETRKHIELKARETMENRICKERQCSLEEAKIILKGNNAYSKMYNSNVLEKEHEIYEIHQMFKEHNHEINHVLLNTGTREDLVNQMEKLIEHYKVSAE